MSTYREPTKRSTFFRDYDDILTDTKRYDEVISFDYDISDHAEILGGATISSVAYTAGNGLTVNSESESGNVITFELDGVGTLEVTVTLSNGKEIQEYFRWLSTDQPASDY